MGGRLENLELGRAARLALSLLIPVAACAAPYFPDPEPSSGFTNFETEPVRPLALSADAAHLYALNTPDDRLEVFEVTGAGLRSVGETMVGLRPVALTLRAPGELWVANHLSDSVNVVDVSQPSRPQVVRTLRVGDEPRGIVAAGPDRRWVFVATARRGDSLVPGIGRADLWVFDARRPAAPARVITLFGTKPRALAVSPDGSRVYAAVFHSGNGTTTIGGIQAASIGRAPVYGKLSLPEPEAPPKTGAIVEWADGQWRDVDGRDWSALVPFELPDYDVFVIDAAGQSPAVIDRISGIGTVLFDVAVRPDNGEVWVSNSEANNLIPHEPRLRGRFAENRVTRIIAGDTGWKVLPVDLNPHVNTARTPGSWDERDRSLAQPLEIVFDPASGAGYLAAFGSGKVAVLNREARVVERIEVGFGPAGLALDPGRHRLYAFNRLDQSISVIDTRARRTLATVPLRHDPTPEVVRAGRPFLYDARQFSGHGTQSCATCHVFADFDGLAWDLGVPNGKVREIPEELRNEDLPPLQAYHPLKGAMTTQSLRGLRDTAPFHWRGDRFGKNASRPGDDIESFKDFDQTYVDLLGLDVPPGGAAMESFARFVRTIRYPPNPNERLDRELTPAQRAGFAFFNGEFKSDRGILPCHGCHVAPAGTNRRINFEGLQAGRDMKAPHLRNVYQKVGRFNEPGPQVSGYGLGHDGSMDTLVRFLRVNVFEFPGDNEAEKNRVRRELNAFVMAFHTGMAPAVGRQMTIRGAPAREQRVLLDLVIERADAGECDLTARYWRAGEERGWLRRGGGFIGNRLSDPELDLNALLARRGDAPVTFLCVPPGDGVRSALDRDLDGTRDGDERRGGGAKADTAALVPRDPL